jgi:translation initiation factor 3 subunit D
VGYRYRTWDLGDDITIAARTEVDGIITRQGTDQLLCIRTFNQAIISGTDSDWRRKLERQSAAALAMEVKNNSARVARWTLSAMLAGCDMMKVGFVARVSPKDPHNHTLLVTQMQKPKDLLAQLSVNLGNCWAIVKSIIELCYKLEKDQYLLMKDPNKSLLYLYEVPANAFVSNYADDSEGSAAAGRMALG